MEIKDKVKSDSKGLAVIITNDYHEASGYTELTGTIEDGNRLKIAFEKLGFAVHWEQNARLETLQRLVWELRDLEYESVKGCKCITLVFSGHGVTGGELITQDGKSFDTCSQLISPILPGKAPKIGGIPKIFLIDACRGDSKTETVKVPKIATGKGNATEGDSEFPRPKPEGDPVHQRKGGYEIPLQDLPKEGNFLVAYSTLPGCIANEYKGQLKGSLWLEIIARRIQEDDVSVEDLLTMVNEELLSKCQKEDYHHQQPEKLVRLNKRLYLLRDHPSISTAQQDLTPLPEGHQPSNSSTNTQLQRQLPTNQKVTEGSTSVDVRPSAPAQNSSSNSSAQASARRPGQGTGPYCERLRSFTKPQYNYIAEELKTSGSKRYRCTIKYRSPEGKAKSVDSGGYYSTKDRAAEQAAKRIFSQEKWSLD